MGLLTAWIGGGAAVAAPSLPVDVERALSQRIDYGYNLGIAIGLVDREGRTVRGFGWRDRRRSSAPDSATRFEIGSVTKLFTATLLAEAVMRGEVDEDEPVRDLLPPTLRVPARTEAITLRHLATHRSGLPSMPDNLCSTKVREPFACYDVSRLYDFLGRYELPRDPDAAWEYSNLGFGLLGHALALHGGQTYEARLRERILVPLGLTSTRLGVSSPPDAQESAGYSGAVDVPPFRMPVLEGAGELRSTVDDLLTLLEHELGFRESLLSSALRETQRVRASTAYPGVAIGLGWWSIDRPGGAILEHEGETPGFTAFVGFRPSRGLGVVVLSNARVNAYSGITDVGLHLLDAALPLTSIPRPAVVPATQLSNYLGIYQEAGGDRFELGWSEDRLVLFHVRSDFEFTLYPQSPVRFVGLDIELGEGASALMRTNASGASVGMNWTQGGRTLFYARVGDPVRLVLGPDPGGVTVSLEGGGAGSYRVEASSDLLNWDVIGRVRPGESLAVDTGAASGAARYFRAARER